MLKLLRNNWLPVVIFIAAGMAVLHETAEEPAASSNNVTETIAAKLPVTWQAPDINSLGNDSTAQLIRYGELITLSPEELLEIGLKELKTKQQDFIF